MKTNQAIANECLTLACFARYTYDGERLICGAFGMPYQDELNPAGKGWNFIIEEVAEGLLLTVDAYCATVEDGPDWDVDEWEARMMVVTATPVNREAFQLLSRAGRALLNGRSVRWPDGKVTDAIKPNRALNVAFHPVPVPAGYRN